MNLGLLIVRLVVGGLFFGHGTQKLFGWFDGHGLEGTGGFMESLGYTPGKRMAILAGATEAAGGAMLVLGLLTPLAAAMIIGVMVNAMIAVHAQNGVWNTGGGVELPLVYCAVVAGLAFVGPGSISIDNAIGLSITGVWYGLVAIALGVITGVTVSGMRREEEAEEEAAESQERRAA
jgi:putative oxidoreductase